ncbi:succinylglutamate desuccinylase/aspartoacylase family protein [Cedecea colo]|uniref:Succinylglutamate desuccinylase n=1 Tax=Cedecea colo TaxID=2552946 RepID=A0ABX0VN55_9ENTR|nr:succinylglutamate desuccinylase/aspartoacylase family protein [Cedecea colo]NIY48485.1 succinylglutamate desuccinylase [Cedecea colo]
MSVTTTSIFSGAAGTGNRSEIIKHVFTGGDSERAVYIQAGLHADEHPGLLVIQHLLPLLEKADSEGGINGTITLIPYANPTGMTQNVLGFWTGRFNLANGENFNRNFPDAADALEQLHAAQDMRHIRPEEQLDRVLAPATHDDFVNAWKKALLREAVRHDVILDLHCDTAGILHFYTNERYTERAASLAASMGIEAVLLESFAGGGAFDEACTLGWKWLAERGMASAGRIPFSVSVELRGQADVSDELAATDAGRIMNYLRTEGFITTGTPASDPLSGDAVQLYPLEGAIHMPSPADGIVVWQKRPGDHVKKEELLGEIVCLEAGISGKRTPVYSPVDGRILVQPLMTLVRTGQRVALIAGMEPLPERKKGRLLMNF